MIKKLLIALLDLFYPPQCPVCKKEILESGFLCSECRGHASFIRVYEKEEGHFVHLDYTIILGHYRGGFQEVLNKIKFEEKDDLLNVLINELVIIWNSKGKKVFLDLLLKNNMSKNNCVVIPVPTDLKRLQKRGYDLIEKVFLPWCFTNNFRWYPILKRTRVTKAQYSLSGIKRRENMKNVMKAQQLPFEDVIIIVDDILTTGATLSESARAIRILDKNKEKLIIGLTLSGDHK